MKEWYSARELAGLPGVPATKRGVLRIARSREWTFRSMRGNGGAVTEYHVRSLPEITRQALISAALDQQELPGVLPSAPPPSIPRKQAAGLKDWQTSRMDARAALLAEIDRLAGAMSLEQATREIVRRAKERSLPDHLQRLVPVANAKGGGTGKRTLSLRTVKRWRAAARGGTAALAPKAPEAHPLPEWALPLLKLYRQPQKPRLAEVLRAMRAPGVLSDGIAPPSYDQARRFLAKVGEVEKRRGRMGPRELKSVRPHVRRDTGQMLAGDCYTADGHTFDAEIAHPIHGRPFRPEVTLILDVATRMAVGWSCTVAESGVAVRDALRHAVTRHGIPALFYVDNGGGYANDMMRAEVTGFMARLGIEMTNALPYNSQARGLIERAHQTILVEAARGLPTFMGADMDREARQIAFKRTRKDPTALVSWPDFCDGIDRACSDYNERPHAGLPRIADPATGRHRHQTPGEAWTAHEAQGWAPVLPDDPDSLMRPEETRTVRRGEVSLFGWRYFSHDLAEHHGDLVRVGYEVADGERVWVRDMEGVLLAVAQRDGNVQPYFPQSRIEQARDKREQGRLQRIEVKRQEIVAERGRIEAAEPAPATPEERETATRVLAEMEAARDAETPAPVDTSPGAPRPYFAGEFAERDWGRWVANNLDQVDEEERRDFERQLESPNFRLLIGWQGEEERAAG